MDGKLRVPILDKAVFESRRAVNECAAVSEFLFNESGGGQRDLFAKLFGVNDAAQAPPIIIGEFEIVMIEQADRPRKTLVDRARVV